MPNTINPDAVAREAFVLSDPYGPFVGDWHRHRHAHFVYAVDGGFTVRTESAWWVVPPRRAVWIPPGVLHRGMASRPVRLRTLYLGASRFQTPEQAGVVDVDPLMDALLDEAARWGVGGELDAAQQRLLQVIVDRLPGLRSVPARLPSARDPRLARLVAELEADPGQATSLEALAARHGMSSRTAARLFLKDTGLTFVQWRQHLRLLRALQGLSTGQGVTQVALEVGYQDVSAFIALFKSHFGETPARYVRAG